MRIQPFIFDNPVRVLFGPGQLRNLHKEKLPGEKALIVSYLDGTASRFGYLQALERELDLNGTAYAVYEGIRENPTDENADEGAAFLREQGCDFLIALGGGAVMDSAKCIALAAANEGRIWDYSPSKSGGKKVPARDALPVVCVTTSAGTGSEVDISAVLTREETREKTGFLHPSMMPRLAVVDAELMVSIPPFRTAARGWTRFSTPQKPW